MSRIRTNAIYSITYQIVRLIFPLITYPYVARTIGPSGVGSVSYASALASAFAGIGLLGLPIYGAREISRLRDNPEQLRAVNSDFIILAFVLSIASLTVYSLLPLVAPTMIRVPTLHLIFSLYILAHGAQMDWYFRGTERFGYITIRNLLIRTLTAALTFVVIRNADHASRYGALWVMGTVVNGVMNLWLARRTIGYDWAFRRALRHLPHIFPVAALALTGYLYTSIDTIMLGAMIDDGGVAAGYYAIAGRLIRIVGTTITAGTSVVAPRVSLLYIQGETERVHQLLTKNFNAALFFTIPATTGMFLLAPDLITLFGGPEFSAATRTMRILAPLLFLIGVGSVVSSQALFAHDREKSLLVSTIVSLIVAAAANALLIPRYAQEGAAAGTVIARITELAIQIGASWLIVRRVVRDRAFIRTAVIAIVWSAALYVTWRLLPPFAGIIDVLVFVAGAIVSYLVITALLRVTITRELGRWIVGKMPWRRQ